MNRPARQSPPPGRSVRNASAAGNHCRPSVRGGGKRSAGRRRQIRLAHENLQRACDMRAHEVLLFACQRICLGQQFRRYLGLADILQQTGNAEFEQSLPTPADMTAEQQRVNRNIHGVVEAVLIHAFQTQQPHHASGLRCRLPATSRTPSRTLPKSKCSSAVTCWKVCCSAFNRES